MDAGHVLTLCGGNNDKENSYVRQQLKETSRNRGLIPAAIGRKVGKGFDYPRLDVLVLTAPVPFSGRLGQYLGRLNHDYEGKSEVIAHGYIDSHIRTLDNMYAKRLRTYKRTGFQLVANGIFPKQTANAIYDNDNYADIFEQDLVGAEERITVSGPKPTLGKVKRFSYLAKARQKARCGVTVVTLDP